MSVVAEWVLGLLAEAAIDQLIRRLGPRAGSQLYDLLFRGEYKTIIVGPPGTGKTTLGQLMAGERTWGTTSDVYKPSAVPETEKIKALWARPMLIAPGQFAEDGWRRAIEEGAQASRCLIIFTTSFGYHSLHPAETWKDVAKAELFQAKTVDEFRAEFLAQRRTLEIQQFSQMAQMWPKKAKAKLFVMIVPTKMDLWWAERNQVIGWYRKQLSPALESLGKQFPKSRGFAYQYHPTCLMKANAVDAGKEEIFKSTNDFDPEVAFEEFEKFILYLTKILRLPKW